MAKTTEQDIETIYKQIEEDQVVINRRIDGLRGMILRYVEGNKKG